MRKRGPIAKILGAFFTLALVGIFIAILAQFQWDIIAMFSWVGSSIWNFVLRIADAVGNMPGFRSLFQ